MEVNGNVASETFLESSMREELLQFPGLMQWWVENKPRFFPHFRDRLDELAHTEAAD